MRFLPTQAISQLVGTLASLSVPVLSQAAVCWYRERYHVDATGTFPNLQALFTRSRVAKVPGSSTLVSPAAATVRSSEFLTPGSKLSAKGATLSVDELLGGGFWSERLARGYALSYYLSPRDYHHLHAPVDGAIIGAIHIPGRLLPVNDWSVDRYPNVLGINERAVVLVESPAHGLVALCAVGALNVGSIVLSFDDEARRFPYGWWSGEQSERWYPSRIPVRRTQPLISFRLGSALIMVAERVPPDVSTGAGFKDLGESLLT